MSAPTACAEWRGLTDLASDPCWMCGYGRGEHKPPSEPTRQREGSEDRLEGAHEKPCAIFYSDDGPPWCSWCLWHRRHHTLQARGIGHLHHLTDKAVALIENERDAFAAWESLTRAASMAWAIHVLSDGSGRYEATTVARARAELTRLLEEEVPSHVVR